MAPECWVEVGDKIWGKMPSWEILEFDTYDEYHLAYTAEENEIADEFARMAEENFVDYPEDWAV